MQTCPSPDFSARRNEHGVALIIVLGFLGLMVMMAVAFMIQARIERMVADSTLEGLRARQIVQTGIAAALQDYVNVSIEELGGGGQPPRMFISGDRDVSAPFHYFNPELFYDSTNLWNGEAWEWLPSNLKSRNSGIDLDKIQDMEWISVREKPGKRSKILGRYAYTCINLSGCADANLLGRAYGENLPEKGYGAATNRNNVRKMFLNAITTADNPNASPSDDCSRQLKLAQYQAMWQGFDTPAALNKLTDGFFNDGQETGGPNSTTPSRWAKLDMDERDVGILETDYLSCYSYSALHKGSKVALLDQKDIHSLVNSDLFGKMVSSMGGGSTQIQEIEKALKDYFTDSSSTAYPIGTDYPSVAAVPMFNEIMAEVKLEKNDKCEGKCQLKVTITPEFWCPFPSQDNTDSDTFLLEALSMGGSAKQGTDKDIWVRCLPYCDGQPVVSAWLEPLKEPAPASYTVAKTLEPYSPGAFEYTLEFKGLPVDPNTNTPKDITSVQVLATIFNKPWYLTRRGHNVDSTPGGSQNDFTINTRSPGREGLKPINGQNTIQRGREVEDPRLNHDKDRWQDTDSGTINAVNSCLKDARHLAAAKMGYEPGNYLYCRNAPMETPAEFGYIPIYVSDPWMTLDIFSDNGVDFMNSLVCDQNVWKKLEEHQVYYTNGTINPYTYNSPVLNAAFVGLEKREVPNIAGKPEPLTPALAKKIAAWVSADKAPAPGSGRFKKDGPCGWARVLRKKSDEFPELNKNQRIMLAHNTWGLFSESDNLFLVFVVAQAISEAPDKVQDEGNFDDRYDAITGERWAVALAWMDTSMEGSESDTKREMDIIMFKYLNE